MGNQLFGTIFFNDFLTGKGLGFNIRGGKDSPYIPGDPSIYVTRIDSDGMAAKDGRLSVGDKLIEVNRMLVDDRHINLTPLINKFVSSTIIASVAYALRNSVLKRYDLPHRRQHTMALFIIITALQLLVKLHTFRVKESISHTQ